eukprot:Nk52_evm18s249 gene=Nk52_evmTU18s249
MQNGEEINVYRTGHDLHPFASLFRNRLYEQFALLDDGIETKNWTPVFNSEDMCDEDSLKKILLEEPMQLIKFKNFRRNPVEILSSQTSDRRLTRVANSNGLPIVCWAHWVSRLQLWQNFMLLLIIINTILIGVSSELSQNKKEHYLSLTLILWFDEFALVMFVLDIVLKWTDSFTEFWKNGWNIFDFAVTLLSAIPEIILLFFPDAERSDDTVAKFALQLRVFRILRALKMIVRFTSLKIIMETILHALKSMAFIMMLLFIVMYIFAIVAVNIYTDYVESKNSELLYQRNFQNLGEALITLFQMFTLDRWFLIWEDTAKVVSPILSAIYILLWVWIGGFVFRNIFVGVIVNHFHNLNEIIEENNREEARRKALDKMKKELKTELHRQSEIRESTLDKGKAIKDDMRKSIANISQMLNRNRSFEEDDLSDDDDINVFTPQDKHDGRRKSISEEVEEKRVIDEVVLKLNSLMTTGFGDGRKWNKQIQKSIMTFQEKTEDETKWVTKDVLSYFSLMEQLMENLKEYEHLQSLTILALHDLQDT